MRKLLFMLLVATQMFAAGTASAQDFKIMQMYQATSGTLTIVFQQLRSDSLWAGFQFGTHADLSGTVSTVMEAYIGNTLGTFTRTFSIGPGLAWYGRVVSRDSAYRRDTTAIDTMLRYPSQSGAIVPTTTGFTRAASLDAGNDPTARYTVVGGWDRHFTVMFYIDSLVGGMPVGASTSHATAWTGGSSGSLIYLQMVMRNAIKSDTVVDSFRVLPPLVAPAASIAGTPVATSSTLMPHLALDVHGSSSGNRAVVYRKESPTGPAVDSAVFVPAAVAGTQDFYPTFSGLPPSDTSYFIAKVTNSVGSTYTSVVMGVTQDAFGIAMVLGSIQQESDTIEAIVHYSNVSSASTCNVTVMFAYGTPGNVIDTRNYPALAGSGTLVPKFIATDTGTYFIYASGVDSPAYTIIPSTADTLQYTVMPCSVDTFYAARDTIYSGERDTLYYATTGAPQVSISGPTASGSLGQLNTLPLSGTTTYVLKAYGLTTVTRTLTITVIPRPSGVREIGGMLGVMQDGTLRMHDMLGRTVLQKDVRAGEQIGKQDLAPGTYVAQLHAASGDMLPPLMLLIQ